MAEINTVIAEASQDLQTIEDFVNLPAGSDVRPRLLPSVNVGTLSGTRQAIFEAGGLPATPFATKALMTASALVDGKYAQVTDDTTNNGLYVKTAGAWVKSDYDPLALAKADATAKANTAKADAIADAATKADAAKTQAVADSKIYTDDRFAKNTSASKEMEIAIDINGLVYREVDENGMMTIAGMDKSVQSAISELSDIYLTPTGDGDIEQVWDNSGNLVRRTNSSGSMYISTGKGSVQHHLRQPISEQVDKFAFNYPVKLNRDEYKPIVRGAVAKLQQECLPYIEPPPLLVHNNYDLPDSILSVITIRDDNPVAHLDFPYGKGGTVHPFALPLRKPLYGFKNILADSFHKYGSETEETPVMFGTNDWVNFELLEDVAQPFWRNKSSTTGLTASNGFLSDPWIAYDPTDGAMIRGTRETSREAADGDPVGTNYKVTKSYDGVRWTPIETFVLPSVDDGKAPSMLYDIATQTWHLWVVSVTNHVAHYTSPNWNKNWVKASETDFFTLHGIEPWHMEVKYVGDRFALVCHSLREGSTINFGFSSDGDTWVMSNNLLNPTSDWIYKPTFTVEFKDEDTVRIVFMWGHWDWITRLNDMSMPIHVQPTAWIKISELP